VLNRVDHFAHESLVIGVDLIALEGVLVFELHDQGVGIVDLGLLPQPSSETKISNSGDGRQELPRLLQKLPSLGFAEAALQADQHHVANHGGGW
jgi:hypothetical protein